MPWVPHDRGWRETSQIIFVKSGDWTGLADSANKLPDLLVDSAKAD